MTEAVRIDTTWTVGKTEDGVSDVSIRINQIRFAAFKVECDSSAGRAEGQGANALSEIFGAMIAAEIHVKMGPLGGIGHPRFPKKFGGLAG